jgi:outer membrane protein assembly factor BamB
VAIETRTTARYRKAGALLICALLLPAGAAARERKILQKVSTVPADPQTRAADSWIDQANPNPVSPNGGSATLQVQSQNANRNQRALVQFDLSSLPNSAIKLATLTLFMSTAPTATRNYQTRRITSLWREANATWNNRLAGTAWAAAGGDVNGAATSTTATGITSGVFLNWDLSADVEQYFGSTTPSSNFGTVIRDATESSATQRTGIFSSKEDPTEAHRPALTVEFIQNVQGLTSTAGNAQVILNWTYPSPIGSVISATTGVLILRQATNPILSTVIPADGTAYTACTSTLSGALVVFDSAGGTPTGGSGTFNDSATGDTPTCAPANDTKYFYKVFTKDAANAYSSSGGNSIFIPMMTATPSATVANRQASKWLTPTGSATLGAPGLIPGNVVTIGSSSNLLFGVKPTDGTPVFGPVSTGGTIQDQPPVLGSTDASIGLSVSYFANADGFVYAVNAATGDILWLTNPTGAAPPTTNGFTTASPSVVVKKFATASYTRATDLVVMGTRNAGSTTANQIFGLDGNTGTVVWQLIGASGGNPNLDIVASTPVIDYKNNAIWVTANSAGGSPSLWKVNPNNGARMATANLGSISAWPVVTVAADTLFTGNNAGTLTAIDPTQAASAPTLNTFTPAGATAIVGAPLVLNFSSPYTVIFSNTNSIQEVIFTRGTNTFTTTGAGTFNIATPGGCTPSAPLGFPGFNKVYFGCTDGHIYQIDIPSGTIDANRFLDPGRTVGDLAMDLSLNIIMAGCSDSRVYAYTFPF